MKKRIIAGTFISLVLVFSSFLPVFATPWEPAHVPQLRNQRDRFRTDLITGGAAYSYPIKVPKGTDNLTPSVWLSYNHDVTEKSLLNSIQVKADTQPVHRYDLGYAPSDNGKRRLTSITEKGSDDTTTLPATTFDYKPEVETWHPSNVRWLDNAQVGTDLKDPDSKILDVRW